MRILTALILLVTSSPSTLAQQKDPGAITMTATQVADRDLLEVLMFQRIDFHKIKFKGASLRGKDYMIIVKEMWNGELKNTDTVSTSIGKEFLKIRGDSLQFDVIGSKINGTKLKVMFLFQGYGIQKEFDATDSDAYSLRPLHRNLVIQPGKKFYALAFILPYQSGDYQLYCAVDSSGKDVESWGKEFDIPHYLIFEMKFL